MLNRTYPQEIKRARLGWCLYDWANSAFATVVLAAVLPVYFVGLVPEDGVRILGLKRPVSASSLWSLAVSLSMLCLFFSAPYLGAWTDRYKRHRQTLFVLCLAGAAATMLLSLAKEGMYIYALVVFMAANWCFAASNIAYNSFLPSLARTEAEKDKLSARGFALGYVGGGLALLIVFILAAEYSLFGFSSREAAVRFGFFFTGLWWAVFTVPVYLMLKHAPVAARHAALPHGIFGYFQILTEIRHFPRLMRFLIAYLFYNDGIQTIIAVSAVFAREELGLGTTTILGAFLMVQFLAAPGALLFGYLAEKTGTKKTLLSAIVVFIGVVIYAFFLQTAVQFWIMAGVIALVLGGSQAASRSLYASLLPGDRHAEFFGFYAMSSKLASILGPFTFAGMAHLTGSIRGGLLSLVAFFIIGGVLLLQVRTHDG
ncbi:MAG: MFS transporter [Desulfonatronovibrionaceae bacterium]